MIVIERFERGALQTAAIATTTSYSPEPREFDPKGVAMPWHSLGVGLCQLLQEFEVYIAPLSLLLIL
jgi:hypothetical protein